MPTVAVKLMSIVDATKTFIFDLRLMVSWQITVDTIVISIQHFLPTGKGIYELEWGDKYDFSYNL